MTQQLEDLLAQAGPILFYLAVTRFLSRTSGFSDARTATKLVGESLFRNLAQGARRTKLDAIARSFDDVGIR